MYRLELKFIKDSGIHQFTSRDQAYNNLLNMKGKKNAAGLVKFLRENGLFCTEQLNNVNIGGSAFDYHFHYFGEI